MQTSQPTCIQKKLYNFKVRMWDAVMQSRVSISICHIDDMSEDSRRNLFKSSYVVSNHFRDSWLLTWDTEPLMLDGI